MENTYWHKQTIDQPLFPDLIWSQPENKKQAGKLLIIGGSASGFSTVGAAYAGAVQAGIGAARILLPAALEKTVANILPEAVFAASNSSGSFASSALDEWLNQSAWADGVVLAGDLGRNSETALLIESYLQKYDNQLTLVGDSVDYCLEAPEIFLNRPETTLVLTLTQLQKLATASSFRKAFTSKMALLQLTDGLHQFTRQHKINIVTHHDGTIVIATNGHISSTRIDQAELTVVAARSAVWWLQNPAQAFAALTSAVWQLLKSG